MAEPDGADLLTFRPTRRYQNAGGADPPPEDRLALASPQAGVLQVVSCKWFPLTTLRGSSSLGSHGRRIWDLMREASAPLAFAPAGGAGGRHGVPAPADPTQGHLEREGE